MNEVEETTGRLSRNVSKKIKQLRIQHGYTLEEVGNKIHFNYSNLSKIERGVREPTFELIEKMAKFYNVSLSYFFGHYEGKEKEVSSEWIEFVKEMEERKITPDEIKTFFRVLNKLKS